MNFFTENHMQTCNGVDLMVDLETLGVNQTAPIISMGAVLFDPRAQDTFEGLYARAFYIGVDIEDAVNICGPAEGGTIKWWFGQSDAAIKRVIGGENASVRESLDKLWRYTMTRDNRSPDAIRALPLPQKIWAKDPDFDCRILQNACAKSKCVYPFHFSNGRSVRTIQDLAFPDGDLPRFKGGVYHDARDDAVNQALMVQACYQSLGQAYAKVTYGRD